MPVKKTQKRATGNVKRNEQRKFVPSTKSPIIQEIIKRSSLDPEKVREAIEKVFILRTCQIHSASAKKWKIIAKGEELPDHFLSRKEAIAQGISIAKEQDLKLVVYTKEGRIQYAKWLSEKN